MMRYTLHSDADRTPGANFAYQSVAGI